MVVMVGLWLEGERCPSSERTNMIVCVSVGGCLVSQAVLSVFIMGGCWHSLG